MQPNSQIHLGGPEPALARRFLFEVQGVEIGIFKKVSGLSVSVAPIEHPEGGENGFVHKFPGRMTWPHIVLTAGMTRSDNLFEWMAETSGEQFTKNSNRLVRADGAITAISHSLERLRTWNLREVFAVRWSGPEFDADSTIALDETLELAHHGFTVDTKRQMS